MIARLWHGRVPREKSSEYLRRMESIAIPDYRAVSGNRGAYFLHRVEGDVVHVVALTFWESRKSIEAFAGADIAAAKYYDFDREFLLELEPSVTHYEVTEGPRR